MNIKEYCVLFQWHIVWCMFWMFSECWVLCGSILYGHAGIHHYQRPIHASNTIIWWIPCNKHPTMAQVDAVFEHGPLCLPEHADRRVQWRHTNKVSKITCQYWRFLQQHSYRENLITFSTIHPDSVNHMQGRSSSSHKSSLATVNKDCMKEPCMSPNKYEQFLK